MSVKTVPLTTLPRPASIELLRLFRDDVPAEEPVLDAIAEVLGDLPLALHLAGSFLKAYLSSPFGQTAAYLEQLRKSNLLAHPSLEGRGAGVLPTEHEAHVGRTFALSFDRLDPANTVDALAINLLARAAWFAPGEPIPRFLLLQSGGVDSGDMSSDLNAEDALRRLIDLGLLEVNEQRDPLMHRLVAAWARGVAGSDQARAAVEEVVVVEASRLNETGNPAPLRAWQPHLRMLTERASDRKDVMAARLCDEMGVHLWRAGDYSGARPYLERAVSLHEKVSGPEHPATASSLNKLGLVLWRQGDYATARAVHERSLAIREQVVGLEHPDTAQSLNDLGVVLYDQEDHEGARLRHERALAIREKVLGSEHPDTARSQDNLGFVLTIQGDFAGALLYLERSLTIRNKVLGVEHPETASSLNSIGFLHHRQGDLAGARQYYERALAIREQILGSEHPDTAMSVRSLGALQADQGNFARARWYLERAARILNSSLGPSHPETKEARWLLSRLPGARPMNKPPSKKKS